MGVAGRGQGREKTASREAVTGEADRHRKL